MTARAGSRMTILALTCLGHVGLVLLLVWGIDVAGRHAPGREPEPLLVVLLESLVRPEAQPRPVGAPALSPPTSSLLVPEIDTPAEVALSAPPVSDSVPRVDWVGERRREVESVVAKQNTRGRPACDSQVPRTDGAGSHGARECAPRSDPPERRSGAAE